MLFILPAFSFSPRQTSLNSIVSDLLLLLSLEWCFVALKMEPTALSLLGKHSHSGATASFFFPVSFTAFFILSSVSMFPPFYTWPCSCSVPFSSFVLVMVIDWLLKYKETQVEVVTGRSHWIQLPEAAGVYEHKLSHDSSFFMEPYFPLLCFCLCLLRSSLSLIMSKSWCLSLRW